MAKGKQNESGRRRSKVKAGAIDAEALAQAFPRIELPIRPPYPPMEAKSVDELPRGSDWQYEPKWDGFRCLAFRKDDEVLLQSKAGQPLSRYFPEVVAALLALPQKTFVLDGEIAVFTGKQLDFDSLLQRVHPAESRVRRLSKETPATFLVFDLLVDERGESLVKHTLAERRAALEQFFQRVKSEDVRLSAATRKLADAERWMHELGASGLDGVIAKRVDFAYASAERNGMVKIKKLRTADCVVGGYRMTQKGDAVGSLLLGLYDDAGKLDHVGFSSSFTGAEKDELKKILKKYEGGEGFTGSAPGGPSRWS